MIITSRASISCALVVAVLLPYTDVSHAFCRSSSNQNRLPTTAIFDGDGTGGWGIGSSRKISPNEYGKGDRQYFDGYKMKEQGDFLMQIEEEKAALKAKGLSEALGVARFAGLDVDGLSKRMNKFDPGLMADDDDLDLSI